MSDVRRMQVGQAVDFCIAYNERAKAAEKTAEKTGKAEKEGKKRKATQGDINAWFG